jgi:hypothetical protein
MCVQWAQFGKAKWQWSVVRLLVFFFLYATGLSLLISEYAETVGGADLTTYGSILSVILRPFLASPVVRRSLHGVSEGSHTVFAATALQLELSSGATSPSLPSLPSFDDSAETAQLIGAWSFLLSMGMLISFVIDEAKQVRHAT